MKKFISMLSILLTCILIFTGCESGYIDIRGTVTPMDSNASPDSELFNGGTYENEFFGFKSDFSADWELQNPKYFSNKNMALTAHTKDLSLTINMIKLNVLSDLRDKPENELSDYFLKLHQNNLEKSNLQTTDGEPYEIELEFLNNQHKATTAKTHLVDNGSPGVTTFLALNYKEYIILIQLSTYNEKANVDTIKDFYKTAFEPTQKSIIGG